MGNGQNCGKRSKEAEEFGQVFLQLNQEMYTWNETLTGVVHINLKRPYPGDKLCFKLKGKEYTKWIDQESYTETHDGVTTTHHRDVKRKEEKNVVKSEMTIYDWQMNAILPPGQYSFPIAFAIPSNLPNSFFFASGTTVGEVRYTLETYLVPEDKRHPKIKFKREITIREPTKPVSENRQVTINKAVKTGCCCSNQGNVSMSTYFEKDGYAPLEQARIMADIDNKGCQIDIAKVHFNLIQTINLKADGHHKALSFNCSTMDLGRVKSGEAFVGDNKKLASLQLPPAQMGSYKNFRDDDKHSSTFNPKEFLTPSTHGSLVSSNYKLEVVCEMDGCMCCDSNPTTALPIQMYPVVQRPIYNPIVPPGWNPQTMPTTNITINMNSGPSQNVQISINQNPQPGMSNSMMPQQNQYQQMPQQIPQQYPQQPQQYNQGGQYSQTQPPMYQSQQQSQYNQGQYPPQQYQDQYNQGQFNQNQPPMYQVQSQPQYNQTVPPQQYSQQSPNRI